MTSVLSAQITNNYSRLNGVTATKQEIQSEILKLLKSKPYTPTELTNHFNYRDRTQFSKSFIYPLRDSGFIGSPLISINLSAIGSGNPSFGLPNPSKTLPSTSLDTGISITFPTNLAFVPEIDEKEQMPFIQITDMMIKYNEEYFEIVNKFLRRVKQNFHLQSISKKIQKFYNLNFEEFCEELNKKKIVLDVDKQNEWEDEFREKSKNLQKLDKKIETKQFELDELVYNLYEINKNERLIIRKNYYQHIPL